MDKEELQCKDLTMMEIWSKMKLLLINKIALIVEELLYKLKLIQTTIKQQISKIWMNFNNLETSGKLKQMLLEEQ